MIVHCQNEEALNKDVSINTFIQLKRLTFAYEYDIVHNNILNGQLISTCPQLLFRTNCYNHGKINIIIWSYWFSCVTNIVILELILENWNWIIGKYYYLEIKYSKTLYYFLWITLTNGRIILIHSV